MKIPAETRVESTGKASVTRLRGSLPLPLILLLALTAGPSTLPAQQQAERYSIRGDAPAVFNLAGNVEIVPAEGSALQVEVTRGGADAARLEVQTGEIDGRETLRIVYPDDEIGYPRMRGGRTTIRVRDDGTFGDGFGGGDRVRIEDDGDLEAYADLRIMVPSGTRLAVHVGVGEMEASEVTGDLRMAVSSGRIETRATRGELDLDTGSGSITVSDARGDLLADTGSGEVDLTDVDGESVEVDTGSGSVELTRVTARDLTVDTGSGSIRGSEVTADRLELDTGSGGIRVDRATVTSGMLDTGSGSVRLGLLSDVQELVIDTGSGSVELTVPSSLGAELDLDTGSGGIDVGLPVRGLSSGRSHLQATVGDGEGTIRVDTGSGGIRIQSQG